MTPTVTAFIGLAATIIAIAMWFRKVGQVNIPRNRGLFHALMAVGIGAGIYAISGGANWLGNTAAGLSIAIGIFYFILRAQSAQSSVPPIAGVGDKIPDFTALDDNGNEFQLASLQGKPFLLKFFRGHW